MTVRAWVLLSAVLMAGAPCWSQSGRLGDVAGSVKLDPSAVTQGGGTVVDPGQARKADRELLLGVLDDARSDARRVADLVAEARSTVLYRDGDDLPTRLTGAARDLQETVQEIWSLRLTPTFRDALDAARDAAGTCDQAAISVREELDRRGVAFSEAAETVATCRRQLEEAALVASGGGRSGGAAGSGADGGNGAAEPGIAGFCESERPAGADAVQRCLGEQYRALAALEARTPAGEMLEQGAFDSIRSSCELRYPEDLAARDRCEQERMTAARLEAEGS